MRTASAARRYAGAYACNASLPPATETSPDMLAQFHAAQTLCDVVVTRWNVTAADQRQGIRTHLLGLVFERWESYVAAPACCCWRWTTA